MTGRRAGLVACLIVTALAAALRLPGLSSGLPQRGEPDDVLVRQALRLEWMAESDGAAPTRPDIWSLYPHLLARLVHHIPGELTLELPAEASLAEHLAAAARPHVVARAVVALLAILLAPGTYLAARRLLAPQWALFAALLVATSLLHALYSRQARPHGALATFVLATVLGSMWIVRSGSWRSYLATGLAAGLAVGTLHSGAAALPPVAAASWLALRCHGRGQWPRLLLPPILVAASVLAFYPFLFESGGALWGGREWAPSIFTGRGAWRSLLALWNIDPVLTALAGLGILLALVALARGQRVRGERGRELAVMLAFALPYAAAMGLYGRTWPRFLLPLVPMLAIAAAFGAARALELARAWRASAARSRPWAGWPRAPVLLPGLLCAALLALPTFASARWAWLHTRPDTVARATRWIVEHVQPESDSVFVSLTLSPALLQDRASLAAVPDYAHTPWQQYQARLSSEPAPARLYHLPPLLVADKRERPGVQTVEDLARLMTSEGTRSGAEWAVLLAPTRASAHQGVATDAVQAVGGELVARIVASLPDGADAGLGRERGLGRYRMLHVALTVSALGPPVDIYSLP